MTLQEQHRLAASAAWWIPLAVATITLAVGIRLRQIPLSIVLGVVAAWITANAIQMGIVIPLMDKLWVEGLTGFPISPEGEISEGDIVDNNVVLIFGWVCPLVLVLVILFVRYVWQRLRTMARSRAAERA